MSIDFFERDIEVFQNQRRQMLDAEKLSVPEDRGTLVIFVSESLPREGLMRSIIGGNYQNGTAREVREEYERRLTILEAEAKRLESEKAEDYRRVRVRPMGHMLVDEALRSREVSGMSFVGFGGNNAIVPDDFGNFGVLDWRSVARGATHLKTGDIDHRVMSMPGLNGVHIPLGSFASAELTKVVFGRFDEETGAVEPTPVFEDGLEIGDQISLQNGVFVVGSVKTP